VNTRMLSLAIGGFLLVTIVSFAASGGPPAALAGEDSPTPAATTATSPTAGAATSTPAAAASATPAAAATSAAATSTPGATLPATGLGDTPSADGGTLWMLSAALVLLTVGGVALLSTKHRRPQ
jgi:hypothetical protein